ncbi:MAG: hypothetical protein ACHQ53_07280 [Polyangiales bacterium]
MKKADLLQVAMLGLSFAALLIVSMWSFGRAEDEAHVSAPPLPSFASRCDVSSEAAPERARQADALAEADVARYPFAPSDGLHALRELASAGGCHALLHEAALAARAEHRAAIWRQRVERDYRDHAIRYERASTEGHLALASADIAFLLELLSAHESSFTTQLRRQQLQLDAAPNPERKP